MKVIKNTVISNKLTLYWWTHWFWITALFLHQMMVLSVLSSPIPFSSLETISTSLKSALVQNDNSFQQTGDQQKIASGSKSAGVVVPLTFETSDTDDLFGVADEINAENIAKNDNWLAVKKTGENVENVSNKNSNESVSSSTEKPKFISIKLEQNQQQVNESDFVKNVNSTNTKTPSQWTTTMLTSVDESNDSR